MGRYEVVISRITLDELSRAPERVQRVLADIPEEFVEFFDPGDEAGELASAYLEAGILGKSSIGDAQHIAVATLAEVDFVVSWNFKHIVHYDKIRAYQAVNMLKGYRAILIYSPNEVIDYDSKDQEI